MSSHLEILSTTNGNFFFILETFPLIFFAILFDTNSSMFNVVFLDSGLTSTIGFDAELPALANKVAEERLILRQV
jgi:hypothetical protein